MHLVPVICFALRSFCTFVVLWIHEAKNADSKSCEPQRSRRTRRGKPGLEKTNKGLFCKYFFVLFVSFVVFIRFGYPLHAGGAPILEELGQLENSA